MSHNCELSFLNLLFKEPLYEFIDDHEKDINVLVLGWDEDEIAAKFVDLCLQMGQMTDHFLNVMVSSSEPDNARKKYLKKRPALKEFVNVNGSLDALKNELKGKKNNGSIYASLNFIQGPTVEEMINDLSNTLTNILCEAGKNEYHYFLVSYGNDIINQKIAECLVSVTNVLSAAQENSIHYVNNTKSTDIVSSKAKPVFINTATNIVEIDDNLNRMAFNAHILWGEFLNADYQKLFKDFKSEKKHNNDPQSAYNYSSSIAFAVSIKYKLADIGILWDDFYKMAEIFENKVSKNEGLLDQLIALEHRRWVLERAETGWRPPTETIEEFCEKCCERKEIKDSDNLIHPCMVRSTPTPSISEIEYGDGKRLWDDERNPRLKKIKLDELDQMSLDLHRAMRHKASQNRNGILLEELRNIMSECNKESNREIIKESERYLFCVENIFDGNVAYSKQYNRYKDSFLESVKDCDKEDLKIINQEVKEISKSVWPAIQANQYMDYKSNDKKLVRGISFALTYSTNLTLALPLRLVGVSEKANSLLTNVASTLVIHPKRLIYFLYLDENSNIEFNKTIQNCYEFLRAKQVNCEINVYVATGPKVEDIKKIGQNKHLVNLNIFLKKCANEIEAVKYFADCLTSAGPILYDGSSNLFIHTAANGEFYKLIEGKCRYFEFIPNEKKFICDDNCRYLAYINDNTVLSEQEMFQLAGAEEREFDYPFLENPQIYNALWEIYIGKNRRRKEPDMNISVSRWNSLSKIVNTSNDNIQAIAITEEQYENLDSKLKDLFQELVDNHVFLKEEGIGYRYADKSLQELFKKAGNILETCLYYAVCEDGCADYVVNGTNVIFKYYSKVNNELDLIMIKDFQSLIVECKGTKGLDQNYYHKLSNLANRLGIGIHKAIVTTAKITDYYQELGDSMHIHTIRVTENLQETVTELRNVLFS